MTDIINLIISEIDDSIGPGDIVGAFINEADINSDQIGKIQIHRHKKQARVEVSLKSAPKIIEVMDDNQIGGVHVFVRPENPDDLMDKDIINYYNHFVKLVNLEKEAALEQVRLEMKHLSARAREKEGKAILGMKCERIGFSFSDKPLYKFSCYSDTDKLVDNEINVGDLVIISKNDPLSADIYQGQVVEKTRTDFKIMFSEELVDDFIQSKLRIDWTVNIKNYQAMLDSLQDIKYNKSNKQHLKDILLNKCQPTWKEKATVENDYIHSILSQAQRRVVRNSLEAKDYYLIAGAAGTGKTLVADEIIQQAVRHGKKILVTASTNQVLDNLLEKTIENCEQVVRIGHPADSNSPLKKMTLASLIQQGEDTGNSVQENCVQKIIEEAAVIGATNFAADSDLLTGIEFDLVVIDDANQATEPESILAISKADKFILLGDKEQFSPELQSRVAAQDGLIKSLFERLYEETTEEFKSFLDIQYRMNEKIMNFSNKYFYNGEIKSASAVNNIKLYDFNVDNLNCFTEQALAPEFPLVFLDTLKMKASEYTLPGFHTYQNPVEVEIVLDIVDRALKLGLDEEDIAVISPYLDQIDLLHHQAKNKKIETNLIEALQGREKEVIIFTTVRSNQEGNLGRLQNLKKLNITLTRARKKIIIVGDSSTLISHKMYSLLIRYISEHGLIYQL